MLPRIGIALLLVAAAQAQNAPQSDVSRMDQVVASYVSDKTFMGSVLVARGDQVLLNKGYGSANLEWNIPNSPTTKFTGFADYSSQEPFETTPEKLVARFRDKPLDFEPGEKFSYSNSGYVLLGYLVEKVSGESYAKFLQENIFGPLGMKDSGYDSNSAIIPRRAAGYTPGKPEKGEPVNAGFIHMSVPFSAGALYSTSEDLLRWEQGLFGGKVLSASSLAKMTTPFKDDYAFGVSVATQDGHKRLQHNGGIEGFNTVLAYYPDDKLTVVVLSNINGQAPDQMYLKLAAVAFGGQVKLPSERKEITVAPKILEQYVGTYEMAPKINMMITIANGQLNSQMSGQGKIPLFAESETKFFPKVVDAEIEFGKDDKGPYLVLHQNGRDMKALRTSDTVLERKEIPVSPKILAQYAGTYQLGPGFDLVITLEGDQLFSQATGQGKFPLFAESETKFFLKVVDAEVEFFKDDKGTVTNLVLQQGAAEMKAPRK